MNILDLQDAKARGLLKGSARWQRAAAKFAEPLTRAAQGQAVIDILSVPELAQYYQVNHPQAVDTIRRTYGPGKLR